MISLRVVVGGWDAWWGVRRFLGGVVVLVAREAVAREVVHSGDLATGLVFGAQLVARCDPCAAARPERARR